MFKKQVIDDLEKFDDYKVTFIDLALKKNRYLKAEYNIRSVPCYVVLNADLDVKKQQTSALNYTKLVKDLCT